MALEQQPGTAASRTRSGVGQKSKDLALQVDVGHASQREMGNKAEMDDRAAEGMASRHASLSPVHTACAEWLQEGSMRSTLAGGSPCPMYEHFSPSMNEGRTVTCCSCGDTSKHGGKQKNETQ